MKTKYYFGTLDELREGQFLTRLLGNRSIGATLFEGTPLVVFNYCPHAGAPICQGKIALKMEYHPQSGPVLDNTTPVLRCPWHGWEFKLKDGYTANFDSRLRLAKVQHQLEDNSLYVWI